MVHKELKALQDHVSKAMQRCMPTNQYRCQLMLATVWVGVKAEEVIKEKDHTKRRTLYADFKRKKQVIINAVSQLYEQNSKANQKRVA